MSTLKISKHSDVPTALELVKEEVDKEARRIFSAGGDALKAGNIKPAKEAIAYAEKLADFVKKIHKLADGTKVADSKAKVVLAKAIEYIGAEAVSKLCVLVDGEPFVSKSIKNYKRSSSAVPIKAGWYVATHSSTKAKIARLKKIATRLKMTLSIKMV